LYRTIVIALAAVALAVGAGACGVASPQTGLPVQSVASSPAPAAGLAASTGAPAAGRQSPRRAPALRVLTEPGAGIGPIYPTPWPPPHGAGWTSPSR
jgi:hypothetical protein